MGAMPWFILIVEWMCVCSAKSFLMGRHWVWSLYKEKSGSYIKLRRLVAPCGSFAAINRVIGGLIRCHWYWYKESYNPQQLSAIIFWVDSKLLSGLLCLKTRINICSFTIFTICSLPPCGLCTSVLYFIWAGVLLRNSIYLLCGVTYPGLYIG